MDSDSPVDKPYTIYRAGSGTPVSGPPVPPLADDAGRGDGPPSMRPPSGRPPRRSRRPRHRGLYVTLAIVAAFAAGLAGLAAARALPWVDGDEAAAEKLARLAAEPTPPPSPSPSPTPSPTATSVTIVAGGDVVGVRSISTILANQGGDAVFRGIKGVLKKADLALVNLETPLTRGGDAQTWKDVVFKGDPRLAPAMAKAGIDVVTMANNHAGDMGDSGLLDSIRYVRKAGVKVCGAGRDLADARAPRFFTVDGVRVAFLGFTDVLPVGYPATSSSPGTSPGRSDVGAVKEAVRDAAKEADYVVVTWHWNFELTTAPSSLESSEGKAMIDAGADLVIGHHPHVLQGVQAYHGGLIAWSTGNLVFDRMTGTLNQTMLVRAQVSRHRIKVDLVPVTIAYDGRPKVAYGATASTILSRVKSFSADLGTKVSLSGDVGHVYVKR
jgi:poly-gamma-glutamate capsule biosynthesis protein CapA/YwtB (metallophosphatase superfamily)